MTAKDINRFIIVMVLTGKACHKGCYHPRCLLEAGLVFLGEHVKFGTVDVYLAYHLAVLHDWHHYFGARQ